ncbi:hypothetical protein NPIL_90961 [Nephila pilipes]|uniref:Uncharacterized protein n=1 Tax=Nephila pilipes TaxID=299642 RepID=A0A8X6NXT6_NEPPI|nr:hypothetical protein NPIL_90961 [Nephila pilipes]
MERNADTCSGTQAQKGPSPLHRTVALILNHWLPLSNRGLPLDCEGNPLQVIYGQFRDFCHCRWSLLTAKLGLEKKERNLSHRLWWALAARDCLTIEVFNGLPKSFGQVIFWRWLKDQGPFVAYCPTGIESDPLLVCMVVPLKPSTSAREVLIHFACQPCFF